MGQTGVTGGWTLPPSHEVASSVIPWKCAITTSDGQSALNAPTLAGASGFAGETGATGQTGVTGGWTLPPSHEVASGVMPWKCAITTSDGQSALNTPLLAGASGFTGDTGATGQTGLTGEWPLLPRNAAIGSVTLGRCVIIKAMGTWLSIRRCLQALAASRATREPPVRRVSQVGGHFHHHMTPNLESCLGGV